MRPFLFICFALFSIKSGAQSAKPEQTKEVRYGHHTLKQYYFVMLTKGPKRDMITDTTIINKLQDAHLANIQKLYDMGKLLVAGPFGDDGNWRGIFIINCATQQEAEKLLATDPMIAAGRLAYEIHPWWTAKNSVFK